MTLTTYGDLVQGTDEWLDARRGILTASVVGDLITPKTVRPASNDTSRSLTMLLVAERITGYSDPVYVSDDMMRGIVDEPIARTAYAKHKGVRVDELGFMVRDDATPMGSLPTWRLGYSPDGLVGDDGLIEIKSRRAKAQVATILTDEVPMANLAQMHAGMLVADRAWCDYVSFSGGLPLYVKRVHRDEKWDKVIVDVATEFETTAAQMVAAFNLIAETMPATERPNYDLEGLVL
jgi:hypothetical protein